MLKILLTGRMGSGKDEVARYLEERHNFIRTAFANGIRYTIAQFMPDYVFKSNRALEIDVGNTFRRWFDDDVWVRWAIDSVDWGPSYAHVPIVISDGRFPREYEECVVKRGFIHVHIEAGEDLRLFRLRERDVNVNLAHFYSPDDCQIPVTTSTHVITNEGTLDELYAQINALIARLKEATDEPV